MKYKAFLWIFYLFVIVFAFDEFYSRLYYLFPPSFQYPLPLIRLNFFHGIMGVYIGLYLFYLIIRYYEILKTKFYDRRLEWVRNKLLTKDQNIRVDLYRFIFASLLISFFADLFFASVREESIFKLIPGLELVDNVLTQSPNYPTTVNVGQLLTIYAHVPAPPIGALIIFILRQLHYKNNNEYPGSRLLLLFLLFVPVLLLINLSSAAYQSYSSSWSLSKFVPLYVPLLNFFVHTLINVNYYAVTISTWLFDWYLFSRLWG